RLARSLCDSSEEFLVAGGVRPRQHRPLPLTVSAQPKSKLDVYCDKATGRRAASAVELLRWPVAHRQLVDGLRLARERGGQHVDARVGHTNLSCIHMP